MMKNIEAAQPLCDELEAWCRAQKLPYLRADDLAAKGYLTPEQKEWIANFRQRWDALKSMDMATPLVSAFKPSFSTPAVWTDELIAKRQAEFAAFQKTPEGIAEDQAFDAAYSEHETHRENGAFSSQAPHG
ncbi:MAG: hypothetical protein Q8Q74_08075 [Polaromonas sp.]|jgi:hypothetical protein|uniref:hypothetical protein n=1 Tax=unclassified Polaromonas TaxID=2638319 RepID=UPI0008B47F8D|nr:MULTISPECIES: hypothetical protein [unclassified Polaromonas]OGB27329.1 MAG: hypothetical protein A3I66_20450 [Burkholderiales bacterium RIFCSPLOWO2_02_FULL_57_36]MDP2449085.1 hypothetical protein [Polaromonas sp.]MDP3826492.1 hypothetical protein [Polaromonas sp.]OYY33396.1 MAG: hypothetical protein B7Y60_19405 [Polaromonas sp. 35-63-35]OYZ18330.1 MAG: hypothetical protein B7Y28_16640 [Polaromonas sp. 16-63-31]